MPKGFRPPLQNYKKESEGSDDDGKSATAAEEAEVQKSWNLKQSNQLTPKSMRQRGLAEGTSRFSSRTPSASQSRI
ncbi:hypothetical protein RchiOBHm_Chr5g0078451 [Rosa chinensis]|uniref:Uncharacterized protein n=1 Tax=Rosa chinensis TaxID=74649 RepID=A0A2P6QMA8_ROSCH|nr:hypothetical protein RchiOBHm_Chr5g0078451 [Rosa chinensis]